MSDEPDAAAAETVTGIAGVIGDLGRLDRAVYGVIADTPTPNLDVPLRELSSLANHSRIWFAIAGGLAVFGGEMGRRAAVSGVVSIGAASLIANAMVKPLARRRRPDRESEDVPDARELPMPTSTSFPSGALVVFSGNAPHHLLVGAIANFGGMRSSSHGELQDDQPDPDEPHRA